MFDITLTFPSFVPAVGLNATGSSATASSSQKLSFMAKAASIPPSSIDDIQVPYFGRMVKYAGDRTYPDWEITVLNDEDYALRRAFETWSDRINQAIFNTMTPAAFPVSYKTDAQVTAYGKSGGIIAEYSFVGLWPKLVEPMALDWGSQNTIQDFGVTLAYDLWTLGGNAQGSGTSGF